MSNDEENTTGGPRRTWAVIAAVAALVALVAAEYYYKAHPQFLEQHFGSLGIALLCFGGGCYLVFVAIMGIRNGSIAGNVTSTPYKRSESVFMFWSLVAFDGAGGAFLLFVSVGHFFGLW